MGNKLPLPKRSKESKKATKSSSQPAVMEPQETKKVSSPKVFIPVSGGKKADSAAPSKKKIEELFNSYAKDKLVMQPDEVIKFCEDLEVDPEDISVLVLAWHFNAKTMCYFSREEFVNGFTSLGCDSINQLKKKMVEFPMEFRNEELFGEIYEFVFLWSRESVEKKTLDIDTTLDMLELLLDSVKYPLVVPFRDFLQTQSSYKAVNKDQWNSIFEFCKTMDDEKLQEYDETGCWPTMLDEFVEWLQANTPAQAA